MGAKIKRIFNPYLLVLFALTAGYTLLNWVLFINPHFFSFESFWTNIIIPALLAGLATVFILRPKLAVLKLKKKTDNWVNFYSYILWIFLTLPLVITQKYMVVATGKLTNLNSIKDITNFPATKYYTVKEYYVHKSVSGWSAAFNVSGRYNRHFNMNIYVAFPIFQSARDTSANKNFGWLGIKFHKKISNRLEPEKKDEKYREFLIESKRKFGITNVADFAYLETVNNVYDMNGYMKAVRGNVQFTPNETILLGVNAPFAARNGNKILWIIITALIGSLTWSAIVFISNKNMDATKKNMSVDF